MSHYVNYSANSFAPGNWIANTFYVEDPTDTSRMPDTIEDTIKSVHAWNETLGGWLEPWGDDGFNWRKKPPYCKCNAHHADRAAAPSGHPGKCYQQGSFWYCPGTCGTVTAAPSLLEMFSAPDPSSSILRPEYATYAATVSPESLLSVDGLTASELFQEKDHFSTSSASSSSSSLLEIGSREEVRSSLVRQRNPIKKDFTSGTVLGRGGARRTSGGGAALAQKKSKISTGIKARALRTGPNGVGYCNEAMGGTNGEYYRGCQFTTRSGHVCQAWNSQTPHAHARSPELRRGKGLDGGNF